MAPRDNPLQIPEIVSIVLKYADNTTLVAAAQVNSLWAEYATDNIWRGQAWKCGGCMVDALLVLADSCADDDKRMRWYMQKIRHVWIYLIHGNERFKALLAQGKFFFANARSISIYVWDLDERHLACILTPRLVALRLLSPVGTGILDEIKARSPALKLLWISWLNCFTAKEFLDFLTDMPSITHIDGDDNREALTNPALLHHIALRPNLEALGFVTSTIFEPLASGHTILPALQELKLVLNREHEKFVLPALRALKRLRSLTLDKRSECPPPFLEWLSACCPHLEEFTVWGGDLQVSGTTLVLLARGCPSLRHLNMYIGTERDDTITDACIEEVASHLLALECLRLSQKLPLVTIHALHSLAHHCPHLHHLRLNALFALPSLLSSPTSISFPSLLALSIDHTIPALSRRRTSASKATLERRKDRVIAVLDAVFPALREFEMSAGIDGFYDRVKRHLEERRGVEGDGKMGRGSRGTLATVTVKEELERRLFERSSC